MGGTRLLIQSTFVVEFFLLASSALYFGLCRTNSVIIFHLPKYQRGRQLVSTTLQELGLKGLNISVPLFRVATTKDYAPRIEDLVHDQSIETRIHVAEELAFCHATSDSLVDTSPKHGISVCPPVSTGQPLPPMVIRNGVTFLFPKSEDNLDDMFHYLFSTITSISQELSRNSKPKPLKFSLVMEHRRDWDSWAQALSIWMQGGKKLLETWSCVRGGIQTEVVLSTIDEPPKERPSTRQIDTQAMKTSTIDLQTDPAAWNLVLYIPRVSPANFVDAQGGSSSAMSAENTLVATIDQSEQHFVEENMSTIDKDGNESTAIKRTQVPLSREDLIAGAMASVTEFMMQECMGAKIDHSQNSLPLWQLEGLLQRAIKDAYRQACMGIQKEGKWLVEATTWVVIDESVAAHWKAIDQWMQHIRQQEATKHSDYNHYAEALGLLEVILEYLQGVRTDPTLAEPLRFSRPQFLAIFAPLCLPLLLPHMIGLLREYKRYAKLQNLKKQK